MFPSFGSPLYVLVRVSCFEPLRTAPSAPGLHSFLFPDLGRYHFQDGLLLLFDVDGLVLLFSFNLHA